MLAECIGKCRATLNISLDLVLNLFKANMRLLAGENIQTQYQGQSSINHGGKLPGEDDNLFGGHATAVLTTRLSRSWFAAGTCALFGLNLSGAQLLLAQPANYCG